MEKYYLLVVLASLMFSANTYFSKIYQKNEGDTIAKLTLFLSISSLTGVILMLCFSGFRVKISAFAIIMALLQATVFVINMYISIKCLGKVNLPLYTLFIMSGGMILPVIYGMFFNSESVSLTKFICIALLFVSLFVSTGKISDCKGILYCVLTFFTNGSYSVLTAIYKTKSTTVIPDANYNMLVFLFAFIASVIILLCILPTYKKKHGESLFTLKKPKISYPYASLYMLFNGIGNYLMLVSLSLGVESSIQYPIATGGTIIFNTTLGLLLKERIPKRNFVAVGIAFIGLIIVCF